MELYFRLWPKQAEVLSTPANEIVYGGAAGGGKSHLVRIMAALACIFVPGCQIYLFRRNNADLIKNHLDTPKGFKWLLGPLIADKLCKIVQGEIRFWNGSKIHFCHLNHKDDLQKYQGAEIHLLLIDEGTQFEEDEYNFLRSRVRTVGLVIPPKEETNGLDFRRILPRIVMTCNPGGKGHQFVKDGWVDHGAMILRQMSKHDGGMLRQFIPALLEDNPSMKEDDPMYESRLLGIGGKKAQAMRWGNWDILEGAYFPFDSTLHVVKQKNLDMKLVRARSFDYGYGKPFSHGWYAVLDGRTRLKLARTGEDILYPAGTIVKYREWYGKGEKNNSGLKLSPLAIAAGVLERQVDGEEFESSLADREFFNASRGRSICEEWANKGLYYSRAKDARVQGWQQLVQRLESQTIVFMDNCTHTIRTIPQMLHDEKNPDDIDSELEDHAVDETRYMCMSRVQHIDEVLDERPTGHDAPEDLERLLRSQRDDDYDYEEGYAD